MAWVMMKTMRTSGSESLAGASNIFLGQTEAALVIKPYLAENDAERNHGADDDRLFDHRHRRDGRLRRMEGLSAGHILTASVLGAPAGLLIAKIMFPETEASETGEALSFRCRTHRGKQLRRALHGRERRRDAVDQCHGDADRLCRGCRAPEWTDSSGRNTPLGVTSPFTIQQMLGWMNAPFAWLMGVPWKDCPFIGQVLGERIVLNEFVGYLDLSNYVKANPDALDPRSVTLASYALCGFANFSSIAIQIGGIGALAPDAAAISRGSASSDDRRVDRLLSLRRRRRRANLEMAGLRCQHLSAADRADELSVTHRDLPRTVTTLGRPSISQPSKAL